MSVTFPESYNSANMGANGPLYSFLPKDILHTLFLKYLRIEEWSSCSQVCKNWKERLKDNSSKVSVKIYLDVSNSMTVSYPQDSEKKPFIMANATIQGIASRCFHYSGLLELYLFSNKVHQNYNVKSHAELNTVLKSLTCNHKDTSYDFLETILREPADEQKTNLLLRKIYYLISDMDIRTDSSNGFIRKLKAIEVVANLHLELVNVGPLSEPELMKMLESEKEKGHLPYITCRNFKPAPTPTDSSDEEVIPSAAKKQKKSKDT